MSVGIFQEFVSEQPTNCPIFPGTFLDPFNIYIINVIPKKYNKVKRKSQNWLNTILNEYYIKLDTLAIR